MMRLYPLAWWVCVCERVLILAINLNKTSSISLVSLPVLQFLVLFAFIIETKLAKSYLSMPHSNPKLVSVCICLENIINI